MAFRSRLLRSSIVFLVMFSLMPQAAAVRAQDLVATESITGGGSAFVFRNGSKKPMKRANGRTSGHKSASKTRPVKSGVCGRLRRW